MSFTPYNAPLLGPFLGDADIAALFGVRADIDAMLAFERGLAEVQEAADLLPEGAAAAIAKACQTFEPDLRALGAATARDGLAVPSMIAALRANMKEEQRAWLHFGTTSQDVIDTSVMMRLRETVWLLCSRGEAVVARLDAVEAEHGAREIMARTRMQRALPIRLADRIGNWRGPLADLLASPPARFPLQLGGPNGRLDRMGEAAGAVAAQLADLLGLSRPDRHWQTDRRPLGDIMGWMNALTTTLGKMGQDIALMAQNEVAEVHLTGGGGSSAMPHKNNPVLAESLVTLARFNAVQTGGLLQAGMHENERSGAAWTLEWMLVPQIAVATGAATRNALDLLGMCEFGG